MIYGKDYSDKFYSSSEEIWLDARTDDLVASDFMQLLEIANDGLDDNMLLEFIRVAQENKDYAPLGQFLFKRVENVAYNQAKEELDDE